MGEEAARGIVRERAAGRCEAAIPSICFGTHDTIHHRRKRRYTDTIWCVSNLLGVCGNGTMGCHGYIESEPKWSMEHGLWLTEADAPTEVSAHIRWADQRSWWTLDDEGMLTWDGAEFEPLVLAPKAWSTSFTIKPHR